MTVLVEIPADKFDVAAFENFRPNDAFSLGNARALMWFSQLGYETGQAGTLQTIPPLWGFKPVTPFVRVDRRIGAAANIYGVYGERNDAIVLVFGGTDPGIWETVATDADVRRTHDTDVHSGFQSAFDLVRGDVDAAIALSAVTGKPLFIAGHSLGGALAALAGQYALGKNAGPRAVYTFGMPRTGGERFRDEYDTALGNITYRLVHGNDIVARVQ